MKSKIKNKLIENVGLVSGILTILGTSVFGVFRLFIKDQDPDSLIEKDKDPYKVMVETVQTVDSSLQTTTTKQTTVSTTTEGSTQVASESTNTPTITKVPQKSTTTTIPQKIAPALTTTTEQTTVSTTTEGSTQVISETTTTTSDPPMLLKPGYVPVNSGVIGNKRYEVYNVTMPRVTAELYIKKIGGSLATIRNEEEQNFVLDLIYDSTINHEWNEAPTGYYLGGMKNDHGLWIWHDGTSIMDSYHHNFAPSPTNNDKYLIIGSWNNHSVEMWSGGAGSWEIGRSPTELNDFGFIAEYLN
jgi:hypothetical protein